MEEQSKSDSPGPDVNQAKRWTAEAENLQRILVANLEAIVWRYRSLETFTMLYDHLSGTCEIRVKLSSEPPESSKLGIRK